MNPPRFSFRIRTLLIAVFAASLLMVGALEALSRLERRKCVTFHAARAEQFDEFAEKYTRGRPDIEATCRTLADWHRRRIEAYEAVRKLDYQAEMSEDLRQTQREYPIDQWIGSAMQGAPPAGPVALAEPQIMSFEEGRRLARAKRP